MRIDDEAVAETKGDQSLICGNGKNPVETQLGQEHDGVSRMVFTQFSIENHFFLAALGRVIDQS
jgi:hypothetical protein